jgi:glycosyltransferase involved in cell wall biosynthesis
MRVALLMNFVAPYRVPLLEALRDRVGELRVLVSTSMERSRSWVPNWGTLDVTVQRNVTFRSPYSDSLGFKRRLEIHVPYDTLPQLSRFQPDAVISGELGARSFQAALYKQARPRVPFLIWATLSEHSEREWGPMRRALRRFILSRADAVLVNGESGARYIARFGIPDERIFRVNQPVDVAMFRQSRPEQQGGAYRGDGVPKLLFVGQLTARKGVVPFQDSVVEWARDNPARRLELWWLGDGDAADELKQRAMPDNVAQRFLGALPYDEMPPVYAQADILALPTLMDEWGLVVNEAFASGLPVLGSIYSQAVEELVREGETGWLFDPLSKESMLGALDRALNAGPEQLAAMRAAAMSRIEDLTPETASECMARALAHLRPEHHAVAAETAAASRAVVHRATVE